MHSADEILARAMELPESDRADLAYHLLRSLEPEGPAAIPIMRRPGRPRSRNASDGSNRGRSGRSPRTRSWREYVK